MLAIIISALLGILGKLPGMLGDYFKTKQQITLNQIETNKQLQLKVLENQGQAATADSNRAIAVVTAQVSYVRVFAYLIISFPFLCCLINRPEYAQMVFANLASLPSWYTVLFAGMSANMWGIPVPGSMMDGVIQGASKAIQNHRDFRLEKARINRDAVFAKVKAKWFPNGMNQVQVTDLDEAIDDGEKLVETN